MSLLALAAAAAAATSFNVPATFGDDLSAAKRETDRPILLPQTIHGDAEKLHGDLDRASTGRGRYHLILSTKRNCWASSCIVASFGGIRASGTTGGTRVKLARGREGRYHSGEARRIEWHERGTVYILFYVDATGRRDLIRLANSAIRNGPR